MKNIISELFITILLIFLAIIYFHLEMFESIDGVFISISTFLFTIFSGFFVSRQGSRYSSIRDKNASLDAKFSTIYRFAQHLKEPAQKEIGDIILNHYNTELDSHQWDYSITHKTTTLTDIHKVIDRVGRDSKLSNIESAAIGRITFALSGAQDTRKELVALVEERIPRFQWGLMVLFTLILLSAVSSIHSVGMLIPSILKAAFAASIVSVVIILHNLDTLNLFEGTIGEHSAQDVIDIIKGKR